MNSFKHKSKKINFNNPATTIPCNNFKEYKEINIKNNYKEICDELSDEIFEKLKNRYFFDFKICSYWKDCSLKVKFKFKDVDESFALAEITCESGFCNNSPTCYSNIHIKTFKQFRGLGIAGLLLDYYKKIAKLEKIEYIHLTISPMSEDKITEYEEFIGLISKLKHSYDESKIKKLDVNELKRFYEKHGFVIDENYDMIYDKKHMFCDLIKKCDLS
jgi:GNAT superfamily N-acetyltransferase